MEQVSELTGRSCRTFAYPNGTAGDFDQRAVTMLDGAGIAAAVTTISGSNRTDAERLRLRRFGIGGSCSVARLALTLGRQMLTAR